MGDSDDGGSADVQRMAAVMREQAEEIERLRMELQRTSIRQKESIPELTPGALDEFVQGERVAQWMRLCVGALKEYLEQAGLPLQRPQNHEGANEQGAAPPPLRDHVLAYRVWEVLCKSPTGLQHRLRWVCRADHREVRPPRAVFSSNGDTGSASAAPARPLPSACTLCNWPTAPIPPGSIPPRVFASSELLRPL